MADRVGPNAAFTDEELHEHARVNARLALLLLLAHARDRGQPPGEAAAFAGRVLAPGWDAVAGQGALVAVRLAALNVASTGAELRGLAGDARRAEATVAGWPGAEELALVGLDQGEADHLFAVFGPIAERLGLRYAWRREGDAVTMTVERPEVERP
jgi:hypothetical protein